MASHALSLQLEPLTGSLYTLWEESGVSIHSIGMGPEQCWPMGIQHESQIPAENAILNVSVFV